MSSTWLLSAAALVMLLTVVLLRGRIASFDAPDRLIRQLLVSGLIVRLALAVFVPAFKAPDEQAHFNVVRAIVEQRALPVQPAELDFAAHNYEAYQPPLYYLIAALPYAFGHGVLGLHAEQIVALIRVFCLLFWWATARVALRLLDVTGISDASLRAGIMTIVCFVPTQVYTSAAITNDNAVVFFAFVTLWAAAKCRGLTGALVMGVALSAVLLSKLSGAGACAGALCMFGLSQLESETSRVRALLWVFVAGFVALLVLTPWLLRNHAEYGSWLAVDRGNPVANWPIVSGGIHVARSLIGGFWAVSGVESEIRQLPGVSFLLSCAVAAGLVGVAVAPDAAARSLWLQRRSRNLVIGCSVALALTLISALVFGLRTGMPHGRLLFGALPSIALLCALGLRRVGQWTRSIITPMLGFPVGYSAGFVVLTLAAMGAPLAAALTVAAMLGAWCVTR